MSAFEAITDFELIADSTTELPPTRQLLSRNTTPGTSSYWPFSINKHL